MEETQGSDRSTSNSTMELRAVVVGSSVVSVGSSEFIQTDSHKIMPVPKAVLPKSHTLTVDLRLFNTHQS